MTSDAPIPPITGTVTVSLARAFELFTGKVDSWWPHQFHIGQADIEEVILGPRVGGRWYERGADGPDATIVEVEHRHFERLVAGQNIHQGITGGGGWAFLVDAYAKMVADQR